MMFHPLKFQVMNEVFKNLVELIQVLDLLNGSICKTPRFEFQFINGRMYIYGHSVDLALLFSLLWANTESFAFYLSRDSDDMFIEVVALS